ncbi:MBL fold metallo-hydrolase [Vibrio sp. WZ-1]|uniref:MBL fold metallo-hydrolase n=1 Tax=Vibrio sp. WZ-1 TaxID=3454501 RepID=UPI003F87091B
MIVTTLVDNSRVEDRTDLCVERGLSLHIETLGTKLLFDMGSGRTFCDNAPLLNIDIQEVDLAVISHRHHDHCNGASHFLKQNDTARIYLKACKEQDYYFRAFGFKSDVGIDKALLDKTNDRIVQVRETTQVAPNVHVITKISDKYPQPKGNQYLYTQSKVGSYEQDAFEHELLLVIKEEDGLVVFTGCAHSGVLNMVETAIELFPNSTIKAVVGGFHLVGLPVLNGIGGTKDDIRALGRALSEYSIDKFYTGHCTGMKAYGLLKEVLGERLEHLPTGRSVNL